MKHLEAGAVKDGTRWKVPQILLYVPKCSTVLLKADMGADVNLMNKQMFNQLFGEAKVKELLQPTPIRMENYGNTAVKVLGRFHAFLCWKDKVYKQVFYVTDCDRSPNLLSRDACYTLGVLKTCYTVEKQLGISGNSTDSTKTQATPIHASKSDTKSGHSFLHQKMNGTEKKNHLTIPPNIQALGRNFKVVH